MYKTTKINVQKYTCHFLLVVLCNGVYLQRFSRLLRSKRIGVTSLTFQGHVTSSVMRPFDSLYAISYWWSSETKPSLTVSEIFNIQRNGWRDLDTTSKQRSRSFILVPINFSYTTFPYTTSFPEYIIHLHLTVLIVTLSVVSRRVMWISIFIIMKLYIA